MPPTKSKHSSRHTSGPQPGQEPQDTRHKVTLGLVPSPEHCQRIAEKIRDSLPDVLNEGIDDSVVWEVPVTADSLSGSNVHISDLLDDVHQRLQANNWDYAICLTDLPIRRDDRIVVAVSDIERRIGLISVSPLGIWRLSSRVRWMIVRIMADLIRDASQPGDHLQATAKDASSLPSFLTERINDGDTGTGADKRYMAPPMLGYLRLLAGMVYANRPWSLFPGFKTTIAAAFATGGYGLIFSTLWEMGDTYGPGRLIFLSVASISLLISWIILAHRLWDTPSYTPSRYLATLYNSTTVITIAIGAIFAYTVIFVLLLFAAGVFIPVSMLESTIERPATLIDYVNIAWVTASVATIGGAIGSSMEDSTTVQNATFGWRQIHRFKQHEQNKKQSEASD